MFVVGSVLAGKYRIDRILGKGGMGMVVAATHVQLGQPFALKFLLEELVHEPQVLERFLREARASAALRGEHVCRVSDVGTLENGAPYIVMELLEGHDLATTLARGGPLPVALACEYVLQACVGVAEAHALSIVHRDLKPANLFLTRRPDGRPLIKVLDFGIAKAQGDTNFQLTRTASVMGSPGYMSPEQMRSSRDVDARGDIWALGVILYELVSGRPPFSGESLTDLAIRVTMDPTPPLPIQTPPGFEPIVGRCLRKAPAERFQDLASLAHALAPFAGPVGLEHAHAVARLLHVATGPSSHPRPSYPVSAVATEGAPTTMDSAASAMIGSRGPRWGIFAGVAIAAAAAVAIALVASSGGGGGDGAASAPATSPPAETAPAAPTATAAPPVAPVPDAQELAAAADAAAPAAPAAPATPAAPAMPPTATATAAPASPPSVTPKKPAERRPAPRPTRPAAPATTQPSGDLGESRY